uniref:HTH CENPB-type domain-containing protein n=1 Tax=Ditylenchus dipsaci TaxID=166011 RepID=A0A915DBB2_9BILA
MSDEELQLREEEGTPVTRKHRRNYSAEYKLEAIDWAHKYSINSAAKKFTKGIRSRIQDWLKNEDEIRRQVNSSAVGAKRKKLDGGGRPLLRPELDIQLAEWIRESRENKLPMSRRIISLEATQLFEGTGLKNNWEREMRVTVCLCAHSDPGRWTNWHTSLGHLREFRSQAMAADGHNDYEGSGISDDEAEVDLGDVDSDDELILDQNEDEVGYDF